MQKNLPRRAELAWQVSRYLWRPLWNFKMIFSRLLVIILSRKWCQISVRIFLYCLGLKIYSDVDIFYFIFWNCTFGTKSIFLVKMLDFVKNKSGSWYALNINLYEIQHHPKNAYRTSSYKTRGYYFFTWPSTAGIIRTRVLIKGWYYSGIIIRVS